MKRKLLLVSLLVTTTMAVNKDSSFGSDTETSPLVATTGIATFEEGDVLHVDAVVASPSDNGNVDAEHDRMVGAGVLGGAVGLLVGGPFFGLLLGFGTAYATNKDGAAGDAARAVGDVALVAKTKAREVDNKHQLVEKSKVVANQAWERAKELDRQHHVLEKAKDFVQFTWRKMLEINREHRVLERAAEGIGRMMAFALNKISERVNPRDENGDSWTEVPPPSSATVVNDNEYPVKPY